MKSYIVFGLLTLFLFSGCKMVDLQTVEVKEDGLTPEAVDKGQQLLHMAWQSQGMENLHNHTTYTVTAQDEWRGLLGKMGKPWPEVRSAMRFKYAVGSFDSQVEFLDGKEEGLIAGLQSWNYYEIRPGESLEFKEKANERIQFGLSAFHYFFEMADRLKRAPIVTYAGEKEHKGEVYDLVFATWETTEPHMGHDQYLLWIDKETGMLEYAEYTLRENYLRMPGWKTFYGSIHFADFREVDGVLIPFQQTVYLNAPKKKEDKYAHRLVVSDFAFDTFDVAELKKDPDIIAIGDAKANK